MTFVETHILPLDKDANLYYIYYQNQIHKYEHITNTNKNCISR